MNTIQRFQSHFPHGMDAVLIRSHPNRYYFTGLSSMGGTLLITPDSARFVIDSRYFEIASQAVSGCEVVLETNLAEQLGEWIRENHIRFIGTETGYLSLLEFQQLTEMTAPAVLLADGRANEAILRQRRIKTSEEVEKLTRAQRITEQALEQTLPSFRPGVSELDLAIELGTRMSKLGSDRKSYDFILTSGPQTSRPHGGGPIRRVENGDFVMMDMGSQIGGYASDMTRTVAVGSVTEEQKRVYEIVLEAQRRAIESIRPGVPCSAVDETARGYIASMGYGDYFGHGLGHSLGIEIHEQPRLSPVCTDELEPGVIVTVEPGIYLPGRFGVRIEDMVLVTETGHCNLTESPKELMIL